MIVTSQDQSALSLLQVQARPTVVTPIVPGVATAALAPITPSPSGVPIPITADPVTLLLQSGATDVQETPVVTADVARRYAESGALTQRAASDTLQPKAGPGDLGLADARLLNTLSQAYRQPASATPLPQSPSVQRELVNAQLPNAPSTGANTPAVIVVDGRSLALNATQTAQIRSAIALNASPDTKLLASILQPAALDPDSIQMPQPASSLRELTGAAIARASSTEQGQTNLQLATPRQQVVAPALPQGREQPGAAIVPHPIAERTLANLQTAMSGQQQPTPVVSAGRELPAIQLPSTPATPAAATSVAAIIVDGRTIPLNAAQIAIVRASVEASFRRAGPGIGASDAEDPTNMAARDAADEANHVVKIHSVEATSRGQVDTSERQARQPQNEPAALLAAMAKDEKVEAVRAIRSEHPAPYEPQLIVPRPQDQVIIAPGPDRVLLAGQQATDAGAQSAITGIAVALAPGITRDDVTAELHQDGYRLTFAGSSDSIFLQASAGLSAQLVFADGSSMRLQLNHD